MAKERNTTRDQDRRRAVEDAVRRLVGPILSEMGFMLFDLQFRRESVGWVLRIVLDKEDTVSVDDCAAVSREISDLLDVQEVVGHPYHLEVSSPGLDRPLRNAEDFQRFVGRKAKIKVSTPVDKRHVLRGVITRVHEGFVILGEDAKTETAVPLDSVVKANLEVEF